MHFQFVKFQVKQKIEHIISAKRVEVIVIVASQPLFFTFRLRPADLSTNDEHHILTESQLMYT